jgi:hypothetical protein
MKSSTSNPIANMAKTLATPKGKADKKPASIPESQLVEFGVSLGNAYLGFTTASESLNAVVQSVVKTGFKPIDLRKAKTNPEGAKATKIFKQSFLDTLAGKVSARTAGDYYELVAKAITSGKDITTTNPRKGNAKGQKSKGGASDSAKMISALLNVWKLSDVASESLKKIEASIDDGMTLIEAIEDYLKSEGQDLTAESAE